MNQKEKDDMCQFWYEKGYQQGRFDTEIEQKEKQ